MATSRSQVIVDPAGGAVVDQLGISLSEKHDDLSRV